MTGNADRSLRLAGYDYSDNGAYFITICTHEKAHTLGKVIEGDVLSSATVYLTELGNICKRNIEWCKGHIEGVRIDNYVIMPNHVHMLISFENSATDLSRFISSFKRHVTNNAKDISSCAFPIWQKYFYDHIVRNEADYKRIWEYIDNNPSKWIEDEYFSKGDRTN